MKKTSIFLFCIGMLTHTLLAQSIEPAFRLTAQATPATCQGNGEIHCNLEYESGLDLEQIRYFYIPLAVPDRDSIVETSLPFITHLRPGNYKVRVSALWRTGLPGANAYRILSDSLDIVTVESRYTIPVSGMLYNIYSHGSPHGIVPSKSCEPSGKLQVKIRFGTFPYYVDVWHMTDSGEVFLRTVTFDTNQYHGSDSLRYDYQNYYTIDSLAAGTYRILCHDGCGYHMPYLSATIPKVKYHDHYSNHLLRNSSGIPESSNIITFKELRDVGTYAGHNDDYYRQNGESHPYLYRFINPTRSTSPDTAPWKEMPPFEVSTFLYDTLSALHDYGEVWGRSIILQLQPACGDTLFSYPFTIYHHGYNAIEVLRRTIYQNYSGMVFDYCGYNGGNWEYATVAAGLTIYHVNETCQNLDDSIGCKQYWGYTLTGAIPDAASGCQYHSYITFPLRHKITNISQDTVVSEGIVPGTDYKWRFNLMENLDLHGDSIVIEIMDYHFNPIITEMMRYEVDTERYHHTASHVDQYWVKWDSTDPEHFCPKSEHSIGLYYDGSYLNRVPMGENRVFLYDRDTICLIESPGGNRYNFTAIPDLEGNWTIVRAREDNHAFIGKRDVLVQNGYRMGMVLSDTNLLPGRYVWFVRNDCPNLDTIIIDVEYDLPEVSVPARYRFDTTCTALHITPVAGQYVQHGTPLETFFQVTQADTVAHTVSAGHVGDVLSIGAPGTYRICMYTLPSGDGRLLSLNPCYVTDTTLLWDYQTVKLEYIYGHVCSEADTLGFVRAKGMNGTKPYLYRLYSAPNGGGLLIDSNSTGIFDNIPVRYEQTVSMEITDGCNAHFITNLTISDMDKIRKCWTWNNLNEAVLSPGDTCRLYGLSLGGVSYHWSGPGGFSSEEQNVSFVVHGEADSGYYRIDIAGGGCGVLSDSIMVRVAARPCPAAVDYDNHIYTSVRINGLCWTQRSLRSTHYSDGRPVDGRVYPHPSICPEEMAETFGLLYSWEAAADTAHRVLADGAGHIRGACPEGWYLPTREQYDALYSWGACALRSADYWIGNLGGTNTSGFTALPSGYFNGQRQRFENLFGETRFWPAETGNSSGTSPTYVLYFHCNEFSVAEPTAADACSIRCVLAE